VGGIPRIRGVPDLFVLRLPYWLNHAPATHFYATSAFCTFLNPEDRPCLCGFREGREPPIRLRRAGSWPPWRVHNRFAGRSVGSGIHTPADTPLRSDMPVISRFSLPAAPEDGRTPLARRPLRGRRGKPAWARERRRCRPDDRASLGDPGPTESRKTPERGPPWKTPPPARAPTPRRS